MLLFWAFRRQSYSQTLMFCSLLGNGKQFPSSHLQPTHFSAEHSYIFCSSLLEHGNKKTTVKKKKSDLMQKETFQKHLISSLLQAGLSTSKSII